jgi:alkanesulfonate monooxygenase SsuD/methylene tetrahydromethanopterin reductase-like flavin-dependent oxidoreductase (luciferase family)
VYTKNFSLEEKMRIGISMTSSFAVEDVRVGARWMIERAKAAAEAGLDSLFVGDHHATLSPYYQNTPILARALAEWHNAPAGALYLLPFRHPVLLAEEIATLAAIAPNRFIVQAGLGYGDKEFAAFGINPKHRPSRFEESLAIMRRLWAGETVSHQGRWQLHEAQISPTPPEKIEVWIAAQAEPAIERAARLGDGWIASPGLVPAQAKRDLERYLGYCAQHRRDPGITAIRRDIYVGETQAEAEATGGKVVAAGYRGFSPEATIVGDVEAVAKAFAGLAQLGFTDILIRNLVPAQDKALACIARLAKVKELVG